MGGHDAPITVFGRNSASGDYGFFKKYILNKQDFSPTVDELPGNSNVIRSIAENSGGIGYAKMGFRTDGVKLISLRTKADQILDPASLRSLINGDYPLAKPLYFILSADSTGKIPDTVIEFLRLIYSKEGQRAVVRDGYTPIPEVIAAQCRKLVNLMDSN